MSHIIVNYVARTRESVVLNDATNNPRFAHCPYIKLHKPKSILCFLSNIKVNWQELSI
jgi:GAF domain-containing protein